MVNRAIFLTIYLISLCILHAAPAAAHDGWSQVPSPIVEPGQNVYVELLFGNHSNDHGSYRIEGLWNSDNTDVFVTPPSREKVRITDTLFYTGETEGNNGGLNNFYVASFASETPGPHIISAEGDSIFSHGQSTNRTLRSAKSFVAVSEIPTISQAQSVTGFDMEVTEDRAEIIPLFNPVTITPDEEVQIKLMLKGEPLSNTDVTLVRRSSSIAERMTTDDEGIITFTTGPADYYLVRSKVTTEENEAGEYDETSYEATMTFFVRNMPVSTEEVNEDNTKTSDSQNDSVLSADEVNEEVATEEAATEGQGYSSEQNLLLITILLLGLVACILLLIVYLYKKR